MLKATGIVRRIDNLGRVVLPIDLRRERGIVPQDSLELLVDDESIILVKHVPHCLFCGSPDSLSHFRGKPVCAACAKTIGGFMHQW